MDSGLIDTCSLAWDVCWVFEKQSGTTRESMQWNLACIHGTSVGGDFYASEAVVALAYVPACWHILRTGSGLKATVLCIYGSKFYWSQWHLLLNEHAKLSYPRSNHWSTELNILCMDQLPGHRHGSFPRPTWKCQGLNLGPFACKAPAAVLSQRPACIGAGSTKWLKRDEILPTGRVTHWNIIQKNSSKVNGMK